MVEPSQVAPAAPAVPPRGSPRTLLRNLVVDAGLPWVAVQVLERGLGVPIVPALALAALIPAGGVAIAWVRERRADVVGIAVLIAITTGIAIALLADGPRFAVLKAAPAFGVFGLACLVSLGARRPVMFFVAREFAAGRDRAKAAAWAVRLDEPRFRAAMRQLTAVWGAACLVEAMLGVAAALVLAPATALVVEPILGFGTIAALLAWTRAFQRRRARPGAAETIDRTAPAPAR